MQIPIVSGHSSHTSAKQASHVFASGWVNVIVAALLMVATFPGRTYSVGLLTEPLKAEFHLDDVMFGQINLWATLLGATFCLPRSEERRVGKECRSRWSPYH